MADHVGAYQGIRDRVIGLVGSLDDDSATRWVPATPDWRVKDLVAHFAGTNADLVAGRLQGVGSDAWTAAQVEPRRDTPLSEVVAEWEGLAEAFDALIPLVPESPRSQIIFDAMCHEFDLRGAMGVPGARDSAALDIGFGWAADVVALIRDGRARGALLLRTEHGDHVAGSGVVAASVTADRFELYRAMTGRRSPAQIAAFEWTGDVLVEDLAFLPARATDLVE